MQIGSLVSMQQSQDNGVAVKLVDMPGIVKLWITVRVFSLASAWD